MLRKKVCTKCKTKKQITAFHINNRMKDGRNSVCKKCYSERRKSLYWDDPEKYLVKQREGKYGSKGSLCAKNRRLMSAYGLSLKLWNIMFKFQKGKCAICNKKTLDLVVDHNHDTGEIRGLLCHKCNRGIGHFNDDSKLLMKCINYLNDPTMIIISNLSEDSL